MGAGERSYLSTCTHAHKHRHTHCCKFIPLNPEMFSDHLWKYPPKTKTKKPNQTKTKTLLQLLTQKVLVWLCRNIGSSYLLPDLYSIFVRLQAIVVQHLVKFYKGSGSAVIIALNPSSLLIVFNILPHSEYGFWIGPMLCSSSRPQIPSQWALCPISFSL